jgi:NAD(P)-dependent dehydrogenase (short-subunit alcohol dehydrogenase family)
MCDLNQKTSLVTGAARGIGRGIALEMAQAGADVVIADLDQGQAEVVVAEVRKLGRQAIALPLDVAEDESVRQCVQHAIERFSRIDILVNNAGVHSEKISQPSTIEQFSRCIDVNLYGVWRVTQALVPHLKAAGGGKIVNIASINGRRPMVGAPGYSASKAAVINLTQSLAVELAPYDINVNALCPGGVMTAMADLFKPEKPDLGEAIIQSRLLKRELLPEDIGRAVVFFASECARNITGQALNVDGGCVLS